MTTPIEFVKVPKNALKKLVEYSTGCGCYSDIRNYLMEKGREEIKLFAKYDLLSDNAMSSILSDLFLRMDENKELIRILLRKTSKDSLNRVFAGAAEEGIINVVKFIWENGGDVSLSSALVSACSSEYITEDHLEIVKYLWFEGAELEEEEYRRNGLEIVSVNAINHPVKQDIIDFLLKESGDYNSLVYEYKIYLEKRLELWKKFYRKWRLIYLRRWIVRVLAPIYYKPENRGGISAKKEIENIFTGL